MLTRTLTLASLLVVSVVAQARPELRPVNYNLSANTFGVNSLNKLFSESPNKNVVYSPISAHLALSMLLNGANKETAAQISDTLDLTLPQLTAANAQVKQLMQDLNSRPEGELKLMVANGLWALPQAGVRPDYIRDMKSTFSAEVANLESVDQINSWANKKTNGLIPKVIDDIAGIEMILANATYFKAKWTTPFLEAQPGNFFTLSGKTSEVPLMQKKDYFHYVKMDGLEAVELPYGSQGLASMIVVMPTEGSDFATMRSELLSISKVSQVFKAVQNEPIKQGIVFLPKFEIKTDWSMNEALVALGMPLAFTGAADFSKMTDQPLKVSYVKQNAAIKVTEVDTEGAAVTVIGVDRTSAGPDIPEWTFRADRPFLYFVKDNASGVILFAGQVVEM